MLIKRLEKESGLAYIERFMQWRGGVAGKIHGDLKDNGNRSVEKQQKGCIEKKVLPFFGDIRENCVCRSGDRVYVPVSGKLLIGFTKYFHSESRSRGR